jgi:hypothetical protein
MTREEEEAVSQFVNAMLTPRQHCGPQTVGNKIRERVQNEIAKLEPKEQPTPAAPASVGEFTNSVHSYRPASQATPESDPAWMRATSAKEVARLMGISSWESVR